MPFYISYRGTLEFLRVLEEMIDLPIPVQRHFDVVFGTSSGRHLLSDNAASVGSIRKRSAWVANSVVTLLPARQQFSDVFKCCIVKFRKKKRTSF